MPNYWVCVTDRTNFENIKNYSTWGVNERARKKWETVEKGDHLIFYIMTEKVLAGIFKVTNEPFKNTKRIFQRGVYPYRMKLKEVFIPEPPKQFSKELRNKVEFIKNKVYWSGPLRYAMTSISKKDYKTLSDDMKEQ